MDRNPYIRCLASELSGLDLAVHVIDLPDVFVRGGVLDNIDVLHLHWLRSFFIAKRSRQAYARALSFVGQLEYARRLRRLTLVWTCHSLHSFESRFPDLDRRLGSRVATLARTVVVHSDFAKTRAVAWFDLDPQKVVVMPHPHYAEMYPKGAPCEAPPGDGPVFLALGPVRQHKGLDRIIDASVNCRAPHRLWIAGEVEAGFDDGKLVTAASLHPHITYRPGSLDEDEIGTVAAASDVMLPPATDILNSGSLVLAMSMGKPCIVPEGSYADGVVAEDGAICYSLDDPSALRRAFEEMCERRAEFRVMGEVNRKKALRADWASFAQSTAKLYQV